MEIKKKIYWWDWNWSKPIEILKKSPRNDKISNNTHWSCFIEEKYLCMIKFEICDSNI